MKIAIKLRTQDPAWNPHIARLKELVEVELFEGESIGKVCDANALITTNITEKELSFFPKLSHIFLFKTGTDALPLETLNQRGITVITSHANSYIVAERALALAFSLIHHIPQEDSNMRKGVWIASKLNQKWTSLNCMCVGILGFGHIGKCIYSMILPLCKSVIVLNRRGVYPKNTKHAKDLDDLLTNSDIIFISLPKNNETTNLIGEQQLTKLKNKYIINVARAGIIDEKSLFNALSNNMLAGYASDVWYNEPSKTKKDALVMPSNYDFASLKNVVMSSHSATHEALAHERYIADATNACISFIKSTLSSNN